MISSGLYNFIAFSLNLVKRHMLEYFLIQELIVDVGIFMWKRLAISFFVCSRV